MSESRQLAAIVFSDISGFTNTMEGDETRAMSQIQKHREIIENVISEFNGEMLKEMADGILLKFTSAIEAVRCANEIQIQAESEDFNLRIGIHLGDVIIKNNDIFGSGVNIASRIHEHGTAGSICISNEIWLQIKNQTDMNAQSLGEKKLKGVDGKIEIYQLKREAQSTRKIASQYQDKKNQWSLTKKILFPLTGLICMIIGGIFWFIYPFLSISLGDDREYDASIAILYMANMSPEDKSYFADGLTDELITRLSRIHNLKVSPRTDVSVYKNKPLSLSKIAEDLNVNYIVEGSVKILDDQLRVHAKLLDIAQDKTIWSDSYENYLINFFDVQDEIASSIVAKLDEKLTITKSDLTATMRKGTNNLEAYHYIKQAYKYLHSPLLDYNTSKLIQPLAEQALKLDSTYAEAYAMLSIAKCIKWMGIPTSNPEKKSKELRDINEAILFAKTALQYDKNNFLASVILIISPLWIYGDTPDFATNKLFILRSMMFDVKKFVNKYPNSLLSKYLHTFTQRNLIYAQGGESNKNKLKKILNEELLIFDKLKNNLMFHPADGITKQFIIESIPWMYIHIGEDKKSGDFVKENIQYICGGALDNCIDNLSLGLLFRLAKIYYTSYDYEAALDIANMIISEKKGSWESLNYYEKLKNHLHFTSGMIYMKWGNYNKSLERFNLGLQYVKANENKVEKYNYKIDEWMTKIGFTYFYKGDYSNSSFYFKNAYKNSNEKNSHTISNTLYNILSIKHNQELDVSMLKEEQKDLDLAETWLDNNPINIESEDAYYLAHLLYWPLYQYYNKLNIPDKASNYLTMAYETIGKKAKDKYHKHPEKDTHPEFFYCRDIIKEYESSLNQ